MTRGRGDSGSELTRAEVSGAEVVGAEVTRGRCVCKSSFSSLLLPEPDICMIVQCCNFKY